MNSRSYRWLIVSALLVTASGAWAQCDLGFGAQNIATLKQQAVHGKAEAQCSLGLMYEMGEGLPQDYAQAAFWFRKAAEQGDPYAQWKLGNLYSDGKGVPQGATQEALWYRKAAEQGDARAQVMLGASYHDGDGVPQDYTQAVFCVRPAWARSYGCESRRKLVTVNEVKRNCMRVTECGEEAWIETAGR